MTINNFVPVIAALVGGMLTTSGGLVGSFLLQRNSRKSENRALYRSCFEEMYTLCNSLIVVNHNAVSSIMFNAKDVPEEIVEALIVLGKHEKHEERTTEEIFDRLSMLISLYFPKLKLKCDSLESAIIKLWKIEHISCRKTNISDNKNFDEEISLIMNAYDAVSSECAQLQTQIEMEIKKFM